jgi:transcriptional regulator with XRE-family HTH domain
MLAAYHERVSKVNTGVICCMGISTSMNTLASRLMRARTSRDLTQTQLAKLANVSQGTVGNIEAGIRGGLNSLAPIAHALQISYWWLRDGVGEMELPRSGWPFSPELAEALKDMDPEALRVAENQLRAHLDMEPIRRPGAESGKRDGTNG